MRQRCLFLQQRPSLQEIPFALNIGRCARENNFRRGRVRPAHLLKDLVALLVAPLPGEKGGQIDDSAGVVGRRFESLAILVFRRGDVFALLRQARVNVMRFRLVSPADALRNFVRLLDSAPMTAGASR